MPVSGAVKTSCYCQQVRIGASLVRDGAGLCWGPSPHLDIPQVCEHSWLLTSLRSERVSRLVPSFLPSFLAALSSRQPPAGTHGHLPPSEADVKVTAVISVNRQGRRRASTVTNQPAVICHARTQRHHRTKCWMFFQKENKQTNWCQVTVESLFIRF